MLYGSDDFATINKVIYSFHVPLFFILSGYVYKKHEKEKIFGFILKKLFRLIIPSTLFVAVFLPVLFLKSCSLSKIFLKASYFNGEIAYNLPVWFFYVLFEVYMLVKMFEKAFDSHMDAILCVSAFVLGNIIYDMKIFLPFGLNRAIVAMGFFYAGRIAKRKDIKFVYEKATFFICAALCVICANWLNIKTSMYAFELGKYWVFIFTGLTGAATVMIAAQHIKDRFHFFKWLSANSVLIICSHYIYVMALSCICEKIGIWGTSSYDLVVLPALIILLIAYYPICKIADTYFPILNGKLK